MDENYVESGGPWEFYRPKTSVKYFLPYNLHCMSQRGSDGWNPTAGTGYPYSGQPFTYVPPNSSSLISGIQSSGLATIPATEDTSPANISIYVFISGTVNPYQSSSWYQWQSGLGGLIATTPNNQVGGINTSGNSLYSAPGNSSISPIQVSGGNITRSGIANVPQSESSWNV